jgi:hypothetical protein
MKELNEPREKHVILSMCEIEEHEAEFKQKSMKSLRFLSQRKSKDVREYPSKETLNKIQKDIVNA